MRALLVLMAMALAGEGYERIGDRDHVTVYKRSGHAIDLAAEGDVDAAPEVVQRILTDYASHPKWVHGLSTSRVLSSAGCALDVYQRLHLPLIEDRDYTLHVEWGGSGTERFVRFHGVDSGPPPPKGVIRVPLHEGSWDLSPIDGGTRTHAIYRFRMELGGHLPMWMARGRAGKDMPDLFEAIRHQVQFYR
jgi:hypothetical protein